MSTLRNRNIVTEIIQDPVQDNSVAVEGFEQIDPEMISKYKQLLGPQEALKYITEVLVIFSSTWVRNKTRYFLISTNQISIVTGNKKREKSKIIKSQQNLRAISSIIISSLNLQDLVINLSTDIKDNDWHVRTDHRPKIIQHLVNQFSEVQNSSLPCYELKSKDLSFYVCSVDEKRNSIMKIPKTQAVNLQNTRRRAQTQNGSLVSSTRSSFSSTTGSGSILRKHSTSRSTIASYEQIGPSQMIAYGSIGPIYLMIGNYNENLVLQSIAKNEIKINCDQIELFEKDLFRTHFFQNQSGSQKIISGNNSPIKQNQNDIQSRIIENAQLQEEDEKFISDNNNNDSNQKQPPSNSNLEVSEKSPLSETGSELGFESINLLRNFIIPIIYSYGTPDRLFFITQHFSPGDMYLQLKDNVQFPEVVVRSFCIDILFGLEYFHQYKMVYRDLKPENILMDEKGHLFITDFGFARFSNLLENDHFYGTPSYLAPEVYTKQTFSQASDFWSLGIVIFQFLTGLPPFFNQDPKQLVQLITNSKVVFPQWLEISIECQDFIKKLLQQDPLNRLGSYHGLQEIMEHSWFDDVNWELYLNQAEVLHYRPSNSQRIEKIKEEYAKTDYIEYRKSRECFFAQ